MCGSRPLQSLRRRCILIKSTICARHPRISQETHMPAVSPGQVAVHLRPEDNVAVAAENLRPGSEVQVGGTRLKLEARVGLGHKLAIRPIKKGEAVTKYGQIIGFASKDIGL